MEPVINLQERRNKYEEFINTKIHEVQISPSMYCLSKLFSIHGKAISTMKKSKRWEDFLKNMAHVNQCADISENLQEKSICYLVDGRLRTKRLDVLLFCLAYIDDMYIPYMIEKMASTSVQTNNLRMGIVRGDAYEASEIRNAIVTSQINEAIEPPKNIDQLNVTTGSNKKRKTNN